MKCSSRHSQTRNRPEKMTSLYLHYDLGALQGSETDISVLVVRSCAALGYSLLKTNPATVPGQ